MKWIIPANTNKYDVEGAFEELRIIDWRQNVNIQENDVVYIYCSKPIQKIMFKTLVLKTNISFNSTLSNDSEFYLDGDFSSDAKNKMFMRLELIESYNSDYFSIQNLQNNGLVSAPQGQIKVNEILENYLNNYSKNNIASEKIAVLIKEYLDNGIKKGRLIDKSNEKLRNQFTSKFPEDSILNISKDDYVTGKGNNDSFCNFLETKLKEDGSIKGAFASGKFGFYFNKEQNKYIWLEKRWGTKEDIAYNGILSEISKLLKFGRKKNLVEISSIKLSPLFKNKILYTYFPNDYICVFSSNHINHFLTKLNIPFDQEMPIEIRRDLLLKFKNSNFLTKEWSSYIFSNFLYLKLNPKSLDNIVNEQDLEKCLNASDDDVNACYVEELKLTKKRKLSQTNIKELKKHYKGTCQLCGKNPSKDFKVDIIEAHHIEYFSISQNNKLSNLLLICPNCHSLIHKMNPIFNYDNLTFTFKNDILLPLKINSHLKVKSELMPQLID